MKILSILPTHNSVAALFEDGKCICYLHEEKFNNIKNYWGFPLNSIEYLKDKYGLTDLDYVVFPVKQLMWGSMPVVNDKLSSGVEKVATSGVRKTVDYIEYKTRWKTLFFNLRSLILDKFISDRVKKEMVKYLSEDFKIEAKKILFLDHHTCHAFSPIYFYNLHLKKSPTLIFTLDGAGDNYCSKAFLYYPKKNKLKLISSSRFDASLGLLYSGLTKFLGMKPTEHEYKVMGLSAYVSDEKYYKVILEKLRKVVFLNKKTLGFESTFNTNYSYFFFKENFIGYRFDNLAAATQKLTEELVVEWIELVMAKYKIYDIACSGGVFMNVKLNKKIQEIKEVKNVYFMPSSADDSLGYGAVFDLFKKKGISPISNSLMYSGLTYSDQEVENYIKKNKLDKSFVVEKCLNIEEKIANLLADHNIVACFNGAGEWGARSLGNRAILANASQYNSYCEINDAIKMRDFWMPFAPTILDRYADKYILNWNKLSSKTKFSSKYMITAFDTTLLAQKHLVAAMHQKDKTIRPQIIEKSDNKFLYKVLDIFEKKTGIGGILNTSFNIHGFPLVGSLDQAMFTFKESHLKYMVLNNFLISKK
ncbi:MAG: carbamoyltransferase C-terminal domain-containing protein [Candidatus Gastranaerophilales bacterium]|nr:carbamoyltransferase C-terminal domain-containing protein [Candidatus Gastranaerophilales bacterium]